MGSRCLGWLCPRIAKQARKVRKSEEEGQRRTTIPTLGSLRIEAKYIEMWTQAPERTSLESKSGSGDNLLQKGTEISPSSCIGPQSSFI